jgi:hypothetical protein
VNGYTDILPVNDMGCDSTLQVVLTLWSNLRRNFELTFYQTFPLSEAGLHNSEKGEGQIVPKKRAANCRVDSEEDGLLTF